MQYTLGDTFRIPGFPDETHLVLGALVRVNDDLDVAVVTVRNVPRIGPNGGTGQIASLPISLAALDASGLVPAGEHAVLSDDFLEGVGAWLANQDSRGSAFTVPVSELLELMIAKLTQA